MDSKTFLILIIICIDLVHSHEGDETFYIPIVKLLSRSENGFNDDCITKEYLAKTVKQLFFDITSLYKNETPAIPPPIENSYATKKDLEEIFKELFTNISSITPKTTKVPGTEQNEGPRDCGEVQSQGHNATGIYTIYPGTESRGVSVRCDMDTSGGGWTVIQRRVSDSDFYKNWTVYENGFGNLSSNFWLGNSKIHALTNQGNYELRIDLTSMNGDKAFAEYNEFSIGDSESGYALYINGYYGTARDSFSHHNGMKFSTYDKDNDSSGANCAVEFSGAWWYKECHLSNLNGKYGDNRFGKGINWALWKGREVSLKTTEMKIRLT